MSAWDDPGEALDGRCEQPVPLGDKIEDFYVNLRSASAAIASRRGAGSEASQQSSVQECLYNVSVCLYRLESHESRPELHETPEITHEIAQDCGKKAAQVLRTVFAESVQQVIADNRKRLVMKAALDAESSQSHSQRHINALIDLLGTWSNILVNITALQLSGACLQLVVAPLHLRVIEMAMECVRQFKTDKRLDEWHKKVLLLQQQQQQREQQREQQQQQQQEEACSIVSLDALLSQIAAMREVVSQYYTFLDSIKLFAAPAPGGGGNESAPTPASEQPTLLGIVSREERSQWRELDASYTSLEHGYLAHTTAEALGQRELLEIERGVLVPQAVEDALYLANRVAERALVAGSESAALAIGLRIVELLDPGLGAEAAVYAFVSDKRRFYHVASRGRLGEGGGGEEAEEEEKEEQEQVKIGGGGHAYVANGQASVTGTSLAGEAGATAAQESDEQQQQQQQQQQPSLLSAEIAEELAAGASAIKHAARGVNSWLTGMGITPAALLLQPTPARSDVGLGLALRAHAKGSHGASSSSTVDLLIAALETDADALGEEDEAALCMAMPDWGVFLSGLAVPAASIATLRRLYATPVHGASAEGRQALGMVEQELSRVGVLYQRALEEEARVLLRGVLERHLYAGLDAAFGR